MLIIYCIKTDELLGLNETAESVVKDFRVPRSREAVIKRLKQKY